MRRAGLAAAAAIMAVASLTACSGGASAEDFCNLGTKYTDLDPTKDADAMSDALDDAVDNAPDDIKSDVETVRDAFADYQDDPEAAAEAMGSDEVAEASQNVSDWTSENCDSE